MKIPKRILAFLEEHRTTLLRDGSIERRPGARGITYRIRFRIKKRPGIYEWRTRKLPNEAVAREVAALIRKWRADHEREKLAQQSGDEKWKRLVAGCREELEGMLEKMKVPEGRKRATRRSFREASRNGMPELMRFIMNPQVTPAKKSGRPRRRRLSLLTAADFEGPVRPLVPKPRNPRSGLSIYFAPPRKRDGG